MTIHNAQRLVFSQPIVPGLGRKPRGADSPLLRWLEHPEHGLLLAPIAPRDGSDQDPIYRLIGSLEKEKHDLETARLLYVAATRAKQRLHLLGHANENSKGELKPERGSLLETLWPVVADDFNAVSSTPEAGEMPMQLLLRRLPLAWRQPELTAAPMPQVDNVGKASDREHFAEEDLLYSGWESQVQRHVGTLAHNILEMIAKYGVQYWQENDLCRSGQAISQQLASLGIPKAEHEQAVKTTLDAVERTLASEKGGWILDSHPESACELALTGVIDGKLMHAIIDRTFVDDEGVRWVIDYKVSRPKAGNSLETFYQQKTEQYRGQLLSYKQLLRELEPEREIAMALYFPLIDGWCEVTG